MSTKILVAHGHPLIAEAVRRIALGVGATALSCTGFYEAKRLVEQWQPRLLLADLALPDALGDCLPRYAKSRGVEQVWALGEEYKRHTYRRAPARDYGTDGWMTLSEVPRDLGPRVGAMWQAAVPGGRGDDTQGTLTKISAAILRNSDLVQSWDFDQIRASFDQWWNGAEQEGNKSSDSGTVDSLFYAAGLGMSLQEAG